MPEDLEEPSAGEPAPARDSTTVPLIFATVAIIALTVVMSIAALVAADDDDTAASAGSSVQVSLSEFAITPSSVTASAGGSLHVTNDGTATHNLAVADTDLTTPDIAAGDAYELDVASLAAGSYQVACLIAGHAEAGMTADLTVVDGGRFWSAAMDHSEHAAPVTLDYDQMTKDMLATMAAYPATTKGVGNHQLEPTEVEADGTKVFDLACSSPTGRSHPARSSRRRPSTGSSPARDPDRARRQGQDRVENHLPIATDVHLHGMNVDNATTASPRSPRN